MRNGAAGLFMSAEAGSSGGYGSAAAVAQATSPIRRPMRLAIDTGKHPSAVRETRTPRTAKPVDVLPPSEGGTRTTFSATWNVSLFKRSQSLTMAGLDPAM